MIGPHAGKLGEATKRFSVVIVTYNSAAWLPGCLASVLPQLTSLDEVIIVDNASGDGTVAFAQGLGDMRVRVVANPENIGYARAANLGLLASSGKFLVLLNPDTEIMHGSLERMAACLTPGVGAVGPLSDNVAGAQFLGHYVGRGARAEHLPGLLDSYRGRTLSTKLLTGLCIMAARTTFDEAGLLDETLVLGADDLEFSWRLRMLGFTLSIAMDSFVRHHGHKSFETREESETSRLIAEADAALVQKLHRFYGTSVPTSTQLWGCPIFDQVLAM